MTGFINNPIKNDDWDPSKGDYVNKRILEEDLRYNRRKFKNKVLITFLAFSHLFLMFIILLFY